MQRNNIKQCFSVMNQARWEVNSKAAPQGVEWGNGLDGYG